MNFFTKRKKTIAVKAFHWFAVFSLVFWTFAPATVAPAHAAAGDGYVFTIVSPSDGETLEDSNLVVVFNATVTDYVGQIKNHSITFDWGDGTSDSYPVTSFPTFTETSDSSFQIIGGVIEYTYSFDATQIVSIEGHVHNGKPGGAETSDSAFFVVEDVVIPDPGDDDNDGIDNDVDNCIDIPNPDQTDTNEDGTGDACDDTDGDGVNDDVDTCPDTPEGDLVDEVGCTIDTDGDDDGVDNDIDECPDTPADELVDADGCSDSQKDDDGDGVNNDIDECPNTPPDTSVDSVGCPNGVIENPEDGDGDGVTDDTDNCINTPNADQADADLDGIGDACDDETLLPDLIVSNLVINSAVENEDGTWHLEVGYTVRNEGPGPANGADLGVYPSISSGPTSGLPYESTDIPTWFPLPDDILYPGDEHAGSDMLYLAAEEAAEIMDGKPYLVYFVDAPNIVDEVNEENNMTGVLLGEEEEPELCSAQVRVEFIRTRNKNNGNVQKQVFLGNDPTPVADNAYFPIMIDEDPVVDASLKGNVPGVAIKRQDGSLRIHFHGGFSGTSKEAVEAILHFDGASITSMKNHSGLSGFEKQGDGKSAYFKNPDQDEYTKVDANSVHIVSTVKQTHDNFTINYVCDGTEDDGAPDTGGDPDDTDGDSVEDDIDNCIDTPNVDQADTDEDGIGDVCDGDADGDGIDNENENYDGDEDHTNDDTDDDGTPDYLDPDDDGDGIDTVDENADPDDDGNPDDAVDTDDDGTPDYLDPTDDGGQELADLIIDDVTNIQTYSLDSSKILYQMHVKNIGSAEVDLHGEDSESNNDNVQFHAVWSADEIYGNEDDIFSGQGPIIAPAGENVLSPGESVMQVKVLAPASSTHPYHIIYIDRDNDVEEENEDNNTFVFEYLPQGPDLVISDITLVSLSDTFATYDVTIRNDGNEVAPFHNGTISDTTDDVILQSVWSDNTVYGDSGDVAAGGTRVSEPTSLAPGEEVTVTRMATLSVTDYLQTPYIVVKIDNADDVEELDETNNTNYVFILGEVLDARIRFVDDALDTVDPAEYLVGDTAQFATEYQYENSGDEFVMGSGPTLELVLYTGEGETAETLHWFDINDTGLYELPLTTVELPEEGEHVFVPDFYNLALLYDIPDSSSEEDDVDYTTATFEIIEEDDNGGNNGGNNGGGDNGSGGGGGGGNFDPSNEPPVADAGPDQTVTVGTEVSFDGSASYDTDGDVQVWYWDFADGNDDAQTNPNSTNTFTAPGEYLVELTVRDNDGATDEDTVIITVTEDTTPDDDGDNGDGGDGDNDGGDGGDGTGGDGTDGGTGDGGGTGNPIIDTFGPIFTPLFTGGDTDTGDADTGDTEEEEVEEEETEEEVAPTPTPSDGASAAGEGEGEGELPDWLRIIFNSSLAVTVVWTGILANRFRKFLA